MADRYRDYVRGLTAPAVGAFMVTPSDSTDLPQVTRAIYCGGTGDISVVMRSGETVTFSAVQAGTVLPIEAVRVRATGTTASNLVGLY